MTGRGAGFCAGYAVPGRPDFAPGWICRGGGGRGRRNRYYATGLTGWQRVGAGGPYAPVGLSAPVDQELQLSTLKAQADNLTRTLEAIKEKIETWEARNRKGGQ